MNNTLRPSSGDRPQCEIRTYNGAPTIFVDGDPVPGVGFWRALEHNERFLADFTRIGVGIVWFSVDMDSWKAPGVYDFGALDAAWERMLQVLPSGYFIPRIMLRPPAWWTTANPSELRLCEDGNPYQGTADEYLQGQVLPSPTSRIWRNDTLAFLNAFLQHHEDSHFARQIIGYHLSNEQSEEWFYWGGPHIDYHTANEAGFRRHLRGTYPDVDSLRRAWNKPDISLETVRLPSIHERRTPAAGDFFSPTTQQNVVDFYRYHHELMVEVIGEFAAEVKRITARRALVGVFYGYQLQDIPRGQLDSGHYALQKLLESPDVDYLSSPTCYNGRELGTGYSYFMAPAASVRLHGKLWIDENDIRTHVPAPHNEGFGKTTTLRNSISIQRRQLANALCNGAAFWWMDQGGGWYDDPALLAEFGRLNEIAVKAMRCNRSSAAEVAIVLDEGSVMWRGPHKGIQSHQGIPEIGHIGAPVDFILLEDLEQARPYRLYVFKYCYRINRSILEMINRVVKRDGCWAVWLDCPGWVNEDDRTIGAANVERLTGLEVVSSNGSVANADPELSDLLGCPVKQFGDWTSVYLQDLPSADQLRDLCRAAGVHLYLDTGDTFMPMPLLCVSILGTGASRDCGCHRMALCMIWLTSVKSPRMHRMLTWTWTLVPPPCFTVAARNSGSILRDSFRNPAQNVRALER